MPLTKSQIRRDMRCKRRSIPDHQQRQFAQQIATHLTTLLPDLHQGCTPAKVALFLSMDGEIHTDVAIQTLWERQSEVYLPRIHPFNPHQLLFLRYRPNTQLTTSKLGMQEPQLNCSEICPIKSLDIILTPLVAFDEHGNRLGMGGGFYDRSLAGLQADNPQHPRVIGLALDCQKLPIIPTEPWDLQLTHILTPTGLKVVKH